MNIKKFKDINENKLTKEPIYYDGYEILDLEYDKPSFKFEKKDKITFIKNNIEKLNDKNLVDLLYKKLLNFLYTENKLSNKSIIGYVIVGKKDDGTKVVYCGDFDKNYLGYKHINFTTYNSLGDIIYFRTSQKPIIFKKKSDTLKKLNSIKDEQLYSKIWNIKLSIKKVELSKTFSY